MPNLMRYLMFAGLAAFTLGSEAGAAVQHSGAWTRAAPPGVGVGAAFVEIVNTGPGDDRLVWVESPIADRVEIHATIMEDGVMKMREQSSVEFVEGERVKFEPGGLHFMLIDLRQPMVAGSRFPLTLRFENAGQISVSVEVRDMGGNPAMPGGHAQHPHGMQHHGMPGAAGADHAMTLHHMHITANHAVEMAAAGAGLEMIGAMGMAPGVDATDRSHGRSMLGQSGTLLSELLEGEAMQRMHEQGAAPEADAEMNYTHLVLHNAQGVVEILNRMPAMGDSAAAMSMHHMHLMVTHALQMAAQGSTLSMLGEMGMAPGVDEHSLVHGRQMIAQARSMIGATMTGPAMMQLHQQGMRESASSLMAYTHELGRVAMAHVDLLARMSPVGGVAGAGARHEAHHGGARHAQPHH